MNDLTATTIPSNLCASPALTGSRDPYSLGAVAHAPQPWRDASDLMVTVPC